MRILHLASGGLFGGVETLLISLAKYRSLCPSLEIEFGICFPGRLSEELAASHVPVHALGEVQLRYPWTVARARAKLKGLMAERKYDLVISHSAWLQVVFGSSICERKVPLVFWEHNAVKGRRWLDTLARFTVPDLVISVSRFVASQSLYPKARKEVLYHPAPPSLIQRGSRADRVSTRARLGIRTDAVVIIQASRMQAWKGHGYLLEALAKIDSLSDWVCLEVGGAQNVAEEEYIADLKTRAERLGIGERVRFLGQRSDVASLLEASDIFCQPNTEGEGFSVAFTEALAAGLPIVTSDLGSAPESVDKRCGVLVPAEDVESLASALGKVVLDAGLRRQMGESGKQRVRELCDPKSQMTRLENILTNVGKSEHETQTITRQTSY